jgi:secreted PhoX family phosphatase
LSISGNWDRRISRRTFLGMGGLSAAALVLGSKGAMSQTSGSAGYGELVPDPGGPIALPEDFQYRVISPEGSPLSSGGVVPGDPDGMAAFPGPKKGITLLVRNHELRPGDANPLVGRNPYDPAGPGGTTGILVGPDRKEIKDFVTSSGTLNNCAGGATPWGTWITCEEDRTTNHGYVFEVDPRDPESNLSKTPIREMGFFSHEAVDIDPATGIAYLTEDDFRGYIPPDPSEEVSFVPENVDAARAGDYGETRVSFLYRYIPNDRSQKPGALQNGGKLQVMTLENRPDYNVDLAFPDDRFQVVWKDVNPEEPHEDAETLKAARFNRLEGAYFAGGAFWFDDTAGGDKRLGQIFRLFPSGGYGDTGDILELFYEGTEANNMESPDNIVITPWGDLWFAEDGDGENRVMGITPDGQVYKFASNNLDSEFAGPTFAPDGKTFFVNIQGGEGLTFAIWGPFKRSSSARQRQMAVAEPPAHLAPRVSGELAEAAERYGMSKLEAAAFASLGVPLA